MSFANHNILDIALSIIPPTVVKIRKNLGTKVNKYGQMEATYGDWIDVYGIVQPGAEVNEHTEGIDFSKKKVSIWLRGVALDGTHIQWAPDQIQYVGRIFNVDSVTDWFPYDNYRQCECSEVINLDVSQRRLPPSLRCPRVQGIKRRVVHDAEAAEGEPQAGETSMPQVEEPPRPMPAQTKDDSLVGKARIRF